METSLEFQRDIKRNDFQIGGIDVVPMRDLLVRNNRKFSLEPLVMDLLCILAEKPGVVFMREDLIGRLWDLNNGGDENLTRAVSVLRRTLREAGVREDFIETIPKRGYRLRKAVMDAGPQSLPLDNATSGSLWKNTGSLLPFVLVVFVVLIPAIIIVAIGS